MAALGAAGTVMTLVRVQRLAQRLCACMSTKSLMGMLSFCPTGAGPRGVKGGGGAGG